VLNCITLQQQILKWFCCSEFIACLFTILSSALSLSANHGALKNWKLRRSGFRFRLIRGIENAMLLIFIFYRTALFFRPTSLAWEVRKSSPGRPRQKLMQRGIVSRSGGTQAGGKISRCLNFSTAPDAVALATAYRSLTGLVVY